MEQSSDRNYTKIKNYVLIRSLGKENIYLALNIDTFDYVVIKSFQDKDEFLRERNCMSRILRFCNHFTCLLDAFEFQNEYYIVSDYLRDYITLFDYMTLYPKRNQKEIGSKLNRLIQELHDHNISHQDLHSKNIMIHPRNLDIRIIDFGECQDYDPNDLSDFEIIELLFGGSGSI
jgi:serine/threonine protein kinase